MKTSLFTMIVVFVFPMSMHAETLNVPAGAKNQDNLDLSSNGDTLQLAAAVYTIETKLTRTAKKSGQWVLYQEKQLLMATARRS
jgi:hypothetical protein